MNVFPKNGRRRLLRDSYAVIHRSENELNAYFGFDDYKTDDLLIFFDAGTDRQQFAQICDVIEADRTSHFVFASNTVFAECRESAAFDHLITDENYTVISLLNAEIDDRAFDLSLSYAMHFCQLLRDADICEGVGDAFFDALKFGLSDRFFRPIKKFHDLVAINMRNKKVLVFCSDISMDHHIIGAVLEKNVFSRCVIPSSPYRREINLDSVTQKDMSFARTGISYRYLDFEDGFAENIASRLTPDEPLFFANMANLLYAETLLALAELEPADRTVSVFSPHGLHAAISEVDAVRLNALVLRDGMVSAVLPQTSQDKLAKMLALFHNWLGTSGAQGRYLRPFVSETAKRIIAPTVFGAMAYAKLFRQVQSAVPLSAFVVSSGRSMESRVCVDVCKTFDIPTVDLQAGTISASNRYRTPTSEHVLCIDETHREIYHKGFGVPYARIHVVGAPRIDLNLYDVRKLKKDACRAELFPQLNAPRLMMLATQPIEIEKTTRIVAICAQASDADNHLVIKPHPSEGSDSVLRYQAIVNRLGKQDFVSIRTDVDVYKVLVAADSVATYFSTIAIEAFTLNRLVLIVDPFEVPPTLNFYESGLGVKVESAADIHAAWAGGAADESGEKEMAATQDGKTCNRIWAFLDQVALQSQV